MFKYEISKYNPSFYHYEDAIRTYKKEEWTSMYDIDKSFNEKKLTLEDYILTENRYVETLLLIFNHLKLKKMKVENLEKIIGRNFIGKVMGFFKGELRKEKNEFIQHMVNNSKIYPELYSEEMIQFAINFKDRTFVREKELEYLIRLVLREDLHCKMTSPQLVIYIGYDYLVSVVSEHELNALLQQINTNKLFISPID